jgi:hypothetical protein
VANSEASSFLDFRVSCSKSTTCGSRFRLCFMLELRSFKGGDELVMTDCCANTVVQKFSVKRKMYRRL